MPSKPRNKKYVPRYENRVPTTWKITATEINELKEMGERVTLALEHGRGTQRAWCDLVCRLVVGRKLAMTYFTEVEAAQLLHNQVRMALHDYKTNEQVRDGSWQITAENATAFREGLALVHDMMGMLTRREYTTIYEPISKMPIYVLEKDDCSWEDYTARTSKTK